MLFARFFLPKNLHMSKIFSTFAADLEKKTNNNKLNHTKQATYIIFHIHG